MKIAVYAVIVMLLQQWANRGVGDGCYTVSLRTWRLATWNTGPRMGGDIKIAVKT